MNNYTYVSVVVIRKIKCLLYRINDMPGLELMEVRIRVVSLARRLGELE